MKRYCRLGVRILPFIVLFFFSIESGNSLSAQCEFVCISQVNLSLNDDCEALISPQTVLASFSNTNLSDFEIILNDAHGNQLSSNTVTIDLLGQNLTYEVVSTDPDCNQACWGHILIEYKFLPIIDCPDDITLSCGGLDVLPLPDVSGGGTCVTSSLDIYLANEVRERAPACDPDHTYYVTRTYEATDGNGNTTSCEQLITLARPDFSNIVFPQGEVHISCSDTDSYIFNEDGIPLPWVTTTGSGTGSGTYAGYVENQGVPFICEPMGVFTTLGFCDLTGSGTGSGTPLIPDSGATIVGPDGIVLLPGDTGTLCNSAVIYTDLAIPTDDCSKKVYRTWEVLEWFCSNELAAGPVSQLITVKDDVAPEFTCPADFTVTTDDDCGGNVELPAVVATDACGSEIQYAIYHDHGSLQTNGGSAHLEAGPNIVTYVVSDNCYNSSSCDMMVTVRDLTEPVAICEHSTIISLGQSGSAAVYASTFDDGSWDECGVTDMQVRRMTTECDQDDLNFGPYVSFCCEDIGVDVMVVFRVFDAGVNHSDCMTTVEVQDKTIPQITCPKDQIVDCNMIYDINNLGLTFGEAATSDNCMRMYQLTDVNAEDINQCGVGEIQRTINVVDSNGAVVTSCKQQIIFEDPAPFMASEIVWPEDLFLVDSGRCSVTDLNPTNLMAPYDVPTFPTQDDHCSLLGYDYEDVVTGAGGCMKITRHWTVIDWCNQVNGEFAIFEIPEDQVIEIQSTTVPAIVLKADPIIFVSNSIDCVNGDVIVISSVNNVCSDGLLWSWVIRDLGGNVMASGTGDTIEGRFAAAEYTISWSATSACGVTGTAQQRLIIQNTKAPIPVCMNGMNLDLVSGMATLTPEMINVGSYSTCNNPITLSFSNNVNDVSMAFSCAHLGSQTVQLWVTDAVSGNSDFCTAQITVVDSDNSCPPGGQMFQISGEVYTETLQSVEDVQVSMASNMPYEMTDENGAYAFGDMPSGGDYLIAPSKDVDYLNGVSTLDIILIQRHVLGLEPLATPYQMIAADINSSEAINGSDIVELRKLILGIYTELPDNTSWRFIDERHVFQDEQQPWLTPFAETYAIEGLSSQMEIDFIGVKVGDVNGTAVTSGLDGGVDSRSQRWPLVFHVEDKEIKAGTLASIDFSVQNYERISGWQGTLEFDPESLMIIGMASETLEIHEGNADMSHTGEGYMTFSFSDMETREIGNGELIFSITALVNSDCNAKDLFSLSSKVTPAEAYRGYSEVVPLTLGATTYGENKIIAAIPNPWIETTDISFEMMTPGKARFEFYDAQGRLLHEHSDSYRKGMHRLKVEGRSIDIQGVIYIKLISGGQVSEYKMIRL